MIVATRRPRLVTIGKVLDELGYVYRRAAHDKMTWADAAAAARILREIRHCLEASDIEQRIRALEEAAAVSVEYGAAANGGDSHARH